MREKYYLFCQTRKRPAQIVDVGPTPLRPLDQEGFVWPTIDEIGRLQAFHNAPAGAALGDDDLWRICNLIWIPTEESEMILRRLIIAYCGHHGRRGIRVMENHIHQLFSTSGLGGLVRAFCSKCLLCLHVKGGKVIPRPFSEEHYIF
ncbi:Hypothetical protein PHPALM_19770 [Phytophthora palmivora]|uniref:Integrase zinc-binding domain-containing protein n=1 Tax=Phytophthora palmivora TaxID=4796 RepID=A0A2P4XGJ3_9STRA|nr:Hypothetical protein PHPALM_19770 [Phytophthora palmivora]